jgi:hypothetical protein
MRGRMKTEAHPEAVAYQTILQNSGRMDSITFIYPYRVLAIFLPYGLSVRF